MLPALILPFQHIQRREGFEEQGLGYWGEVLSEGTQIGSQRSWAASAKGSDPSQGIQ